MVNCPAFSFPFYSSCERSQLVPSVLVVNYSEQIKGAHFLVFLKSDRLCKGCSSLLRWEGTENAGLDSGSSSEVRVGSEVTVLKWYSVIHQVSSFSQITAE